MVVLGEGEGEPRLCQQHHWTAGTQTGRRVDGVERGEQEVKKQSHLGPVSVGAGALVGLPVRQSVRHESNLQN